MYIIRYTAPETGQSWVWSGRRWAQDRSEAKLWRDKSAADTYLAEQYDSHPGYMTWGGAQVEKSLDVVPKDGRYRDFVIRYDHKYITKGEKSYWGGGQRMWTKNVLEASRWHTASEAAAVVDERPPGMPLEVAVVAVPVLNTVPPKVFVTVQCKNNEMHAVWVTMHQDSALGVQAQVDEFVRNTWENAVDWTWEEAAPTPDNI